MDAHARGRSGCKKKDDFRRELIRILLFGGLIRNVRRKFVMELLKINCTFPTTFRAGRLKAHSRNARVRSSIKIVRPTYSDYLYRLLRSCKKKADAPLYLPVFHLFQSHTSLLCRGLQSEKCERMTKRFYLSLARQFLPDRLITSLT